MKTPRPLNAGQTAAAQAFAEFMFSPEKELAITGPGGTGKTHMMQHIIDVEIPQYHQACKLMGIEPLFTDVAVTATTNKAAAVLARATGRPAQTIQSFLNLKVEDDYSTGRSVLTKTRNWKVHERYVIFVDEASMIDTPLYNLIHAGTLGCKIVYLGDHCQLAPVKERISPVFRGDKIPMLHLTEPMRNAGQPALVDVCNHLRDCVENLKLPEIQIVPGVIDHLDDEQMSAEVDKQFINPTDDHRIVAYTNQRVIDYNDHIRGVRNLPATPCVGDILTVNSGIKLKGHYLYAEQELEVVYVGATSQQVIYPGTPNEMTLDLLQISVLLDGLDVSIIVPADVDHFRRCQKYIAKLKDWSTYYDLKNAYPDLRHSDAGTVYKAQGSTYSTTFVDLTDISTCTNFEQALRMLYVALSRSKERVVLYGNLAPRIGSLIH